MKYVLRAFGCGIDRKTFETSFEALAEEEQERITRVALRMRMALQLRYQLRFVRSPFEDSEFWSRLWRAEIPSLEVYLLTTCLDTLAGKPLYQTFDHWLAKQTSHGPFDRSDVVALFESWRDEYGPRRNIKDLLLNLPPSVKDWLSKHVGLARSNGDLMIELFKDFYDARRSKFTHESIVRHTRIAEDVGSPEEEPRILPVGEDLWYRMGVDAATILRVVIHSVVLQKMGIEPSRQLVDAHVTALSRLSALYGFVGEVSSNADAISWWTDFDGFPTADLETYFVLVGVPRLSCQWACRLADRLIPDYTLERGLRETVIEYRDAVDCLNSATADFNESNPPSRDNTSERVRDIKRFLRNQADSRCYGSLVEMPTRTEMKNMWIVIRDPCYT